MRQCHIGGFEANEDWANFFVRKERVIPETRAIAHTLRLSPHLLDKTLETWLQNHWKRKNRRELLCSIQLRSSYFCWVAMFALVICPNWM